MSLYNERLGFDESSSAETGFDLREDYGEESFENRVSALYEHGRRVYMENPPMAIYDSRGGALSVEKLEALSRTLPE